MAGLLEACAGAEEEFQSCDLSLIFKEAFQNALPLAASKGILLKKESDLRGTASLQKEHFLRAVGNLLDNAIEYNPFRRHSLSERFHDRKVLAAHCIRPGARLYERSSGPRHQTSVEGRYRPQSGRSQRTGTLDCCTGSKSHSGELELNNWERGGMVTIRMP